MANSLPEQAPRSGERTPIESAAHPPIARHPFSFSPKKLWTAQEVAAFLRVGRNAPYEMADRGELPFIRVGQRLRFDPAKVREYLERQSSGAPPLRRGGR